MAASIMAPLSILSKIPLKKVLLGNIVLAKPVVAESLYKDSGALIFVIRRPG